MLLATQKTSVIDKERLLQVVNGSLSSWTTYAPYLDFFWRRLRHSLPVPAEEVPHDVITMNSRFALGDDRDGGTTSYTLVYPEDEAPHLGHVSVLSPMGIALYGAKVGDKVCWMSASGPEVATVEEMTYQPEAAGHHHH